MKKVYIGCSLAKSTDEFLEEIKSLKKELRKHFEVLEFLGKIKGNPKDVFTHDISCVKNADLFIAEVTHPSTGLGFEIATALNKNIPTLAFAKKGEVVSRLVQGINYSSFSFFWYDDVEEIVNKAKEYV